MEMWRCRHVDMWTCGNVHRCRCRGASVGYRQRCMGTEVQGHAEVMQTRSCRGCAEWSCRGHEEVIKRSCRVA